MTEQILFESFNSLKGIDDFKKLSLQDKILFCDYMNQQRQRNNEAEKEEDIVYDEVDSIEDFLKENNAISLEEAKRLIIANVRKIYEMNGDL